MSRRRLVVENVGKSENINPDKHRLHNRADRNARAEKRTDEEYDGNAPTGEGTAGVNEVGKANESDDAHCDGVSALDGNISREHSDKKDYQRRHEHCHRTREGFNQHAVEERALNSPVVRLKGEGKRADTDNEEFKEQEVVGIEGIARHGNYREERDKDGEYRLDHEQIKDTHQEEGGESKHEASDGNSEDEA